MSLKLKIKETIKEIKHASDSDDVPGIIRRLMDELIDADIMGLELRLFLQYLYIDLSSERLQVNDVIEMNNLKCAIDMTERFGKILGMKVYLYELN